MDFESSNASWGPEGPGPPAYLCSLSASLSWLLAVLEAGDVLRAPGARAGWGEPGGELSLTVERGAVKPRTGLRGSSGEPG